MHASARSLTHSLSNQLTNQPTNQPTNQTNELAALPPCPCSTRRVLTTFFKERACETLVRPVDDEATLQKVRAFSPTAKKRWVTCCLVDC